MASLKTKILILIVTLLISCSKNDPAPATIPDRSATLIGTWDEDYQLCFVYTYPCNGRYDYGQPYPCCEVLEITPTTFTSTLSGVSKSFT